MNRGYLTFAINNDEIDYVRLAYLQALSIKATQKINQYAVVVKNANDIPNKYLSVFDHVIELPHTQNKFEHESYAFKLSPFKETVKVEADILFTENIDHWWQRYTNPVVVTNQVLTYWGDVYKDRSQRKLFDDNNLPNVYSGWVYFRYSQEAANFFKLVQSIFENWNWFRDEYLKNCRYEHPVTDEVYAIACKIIGEQKTTIKNTIPTFVHMKPAGQNLHDNKPWYQQVYVQKDNNNLSIGFYKQSMPFHYCDKSFVTEELIQKYE
jgi:hypothetical protein